MLAVLVPWKLAYYGELLPTAFYAKSATRPYVSQGLVYVSLYLLKNWFLLAAGGLALGAFALRERRPRRRPGGRCVLARERALFTAYLVHVGGDFMFARRILPVGAARAARAREPHRAHPGSAPARRRGGGDARGRRASRPLYGAAA